MRTGMRAVVRRVFEILASYGLGVAILFLLLLLTLFGTLEQANLGLYETQKKYFESWFLIHDLFGLVPIILPGAYLLMGLLFINMLCGALVRARKDWRRPGMLIAHSGILFLLLSGFVTYHFSQTGHVTLFETERSNEFESYHEWEIAIRQDGSATQWIVPEEAFSDLAPGQERLLRSDSLPWDLRLKSFVKNSVPQAASSNEKAVDGFVLAPLPTAKEAEQNVAGVYAEVIQKNGSQVHTGILWGQARAPWVVTMDGKTWAIDLQRKRWQLPFTIALDKFTRELHPGTEIARSFQSEVTKIEGGVNRKIRIRMNEPLRHRGYTFFQSGWGPEGAGPNTPLFSTLAVVKNPADQWPKYACYIIALGLAIHFSQNLYRYLKLEQRQEL